MDLPSVGVTFMLIGCELNWEYTSNYVTYRLVTFAKVYTGLRSFTFFGHHYICCWKICMKSDPQQFILIPS